MCVRIYLPVLYLKYIPTYCQYFTSLPACFRHFVRNKECPLGCDSTASAWRSKGSDFLIVVHHVDFFLQKGLDRALFYYSVSVEISI